MLNPEFKLNEKMFDRDPECLSTRKGFGEGLIKAAELDKRVVGLSADLVESVGMLGFKQKFPERYIEVGVAEQNLVTVASGMASMGKIPFAASYAVFSPGRNWEQIRTTICYNNVPVKLVGSHAGITVGPDGGSHQALEDIAMMRVLPRMTVISPCDAIEAKKAVMLAAKSLGPVYIRLCRNSTPVMTTQDTPFEIGKSYVFYRPEVHAGGSGRSDQELDATIIGTGPILYKALKAAKTLESRGKKVEVINMPTIKPIDEEVIIKHAHLSKAVVTVEEHQIAGGMGSAVAECLASHFPVPIEFVGVRDDFGQSGTPEELISHYHIGEKDIISAVEKVILRKS